MAYFKVIESIESSHLLENGACYGQNLIRANFVDFVEHSLPYDCVYRSNASKHDNLQLVVDAMCPSHQLAGILVTILGMATAEQPYEE